MAEFVFHDSKPDEHGRRFFTIVSYDRNGIFRPEPGVKVHGPVGFRRGQCFFAPPKEYMKPGDTVVEEVLA